MAHLQTAEVCRSQGIRFTPLVAETTGAWEPQSAAFLKRVARAVAAREGSDAAQLGRAAGAGTQCHGSSLPCTCCSAPTSEQHLREKLLLPPVWT